MLAPNLKLSGTPSPLMSISGALQLTVHVEPSMQSHLEVSGIGLPLSSRQMSLRRLAASCPLLQATGSTLANAGKPVPGPLLTTITGTALELRATDGTVKAEIVTLRPVSGGWLTGSAAAGTGAPLGASKLAK